MEPPNTAAAAGAPAGDAQVAALHATFAAAGQGHVTEALAQLGPGPEKEAMLAQLATIDPARCNDLFKRATTLEPAKGGVFSPLTDIAPVEGTGAERKRWRRMGLNEVAAGRVGTLLLAGGQGTRLGFDHPKGMYDIGLPSGRSLFAIQAARLLKLQELANTHAMRDDATVYWYIMTSPAVDTETRAAFVAADYFGLKPEQVFFFCQGMLPCMTDGGKIMLESASSVAMAPNGNGGLYEGLAAAEPTRGMSALQHMEQHGVEFVPQYCVDNALVKIADPIFVGFCVDTQAECAAKVIPKAHAHEKVGVIMKRDGKVGVVEYSEIDAATAEQTNEDGSLTYSACHLCINYFTRAFFVQAAESLVAKMPLHVAHKKIPYYDPATKSVVTPDKSNGIKMELFIFDTFPFTERFSALEVKNAPGSASDSPDTARAMVTACHQRWAAAAGGSFAEAAAVGGEFEIDPALSYDGEGLDGGLMAQLCPEGGWVLPTLLKPPVVDAIADERDMERLQTGHCNAEESDAQENGAAVAPSEAAPEVEATPMDTTE